MNTRKDEEKKIKLSFCQYGKSLICYLPVDRWIVFPYGKTSCEMGRNSSINLLEIPELVGKISKADNDPAEKSIPKHLKEKEKPCLALAHLLGNLIKLANCVRVYEGEIIFKRSYMSDRFKKDVCRYVGEYFSLRDSGGSLYDLYYSTTSCY